jgi:hypothetical protein
MVISVLHSLLTVAWVLLDFVIAGIVIYRFRMTLSSWLIAGGFVFFALVRIINSLFNCSCACTRSSAWSWPAAWASSPGACGSSPRPDP